MKLMLYGKGFRTVRERCVNVVLPVEKRGNVRTFSSESRLRLRDFLLSKTVHGCVPFGVTLTIPLQRDIRLAVDRFSVAVHRLRVYFVRRYPTYGYVWRVELQRNRMPHLHLVVYGRDTFGVSSAFVLRMWYRIVISLFDVPSSYDFLLHGCDCRVLDGNIAAYRYICDHTCKGKQAQLGYQGRQWGVVGRGNFVDGDCIPVEIPPCLENEFRRMVRRLLSFRVYPPSVISGRVKRPCPFGCRHINRRNLNAVSYVSRETVLHWLTARSAYLPFCSGVVDCLFGELPF